MLRYSPLFAGFAVNDISKAKDFYGRTLGFEVDVISWLGFGRQTVTAC